MDSERNPNILDTPVLEVGPSVVSELIGTNQRALDQNFHANELENQVAPQCYFNVETDSFLAVPMARSEPQTRITNHVEVNSTTRISTTANRGQTPDVVEVDSQSNASLTKKSPLKLSKNTMIKKRRTSRTTSEVWDHFTAKELEEGPIAVCNYCEKVYLCDRSIHGTSTLRKHLMNSCTTSPFWNKGKRRKLTSGGQEYGTPKQQFNAEDCRRALARMIIIDEMPFSTVEGEGFKQYSKTLQPKFELPSRVTVARDCYKMYLEERKRLKESLKRHRICFTTDTWTSIQNLNYMSLTVHWVDDKWKLQSRVLNFCVVPDHKGETIGEKIEECLLEWEIDRIFTLTIDNATSNDSAIRYLKRINKDWEGTILKNDFMHIRCSTHIVNLIVKSGMKGTIDSVRRIRSAVQFVRGSPSRTTQFKKCAEKEKIVNRNVLSWDVDTRWNSTYLMLESAVVYERAFKRLEGNKQYLAYFGEDGRPPDEIDWENARQLISFLKLFYNVTVRLSGSHYVTSSAFFHDFLLMHNKLVQYSVGSDPSLAVMAIRMKQKFDKYWGNINTLNPLLFIAVALDPRYKLKYLNFCFSRIYDREDAKHFSQKVKEGLTSLFECYVKFAANSSCAEKNSQLHFAINVEEYEDDPCNLLAAQFAIHLEEIESKESNLELSRYLAENCEKSEDKFDILGWWKGHSNKYPVLSKLAKDILAVPVSTVASESTFSTGGRVLDPFRSSLSTAMVEALICAQSWFRSSPRNMDIRASIEDLQKYEDLEQELAALVGGDTS